jgi:Pyridoxamine 5'-phosphate oxidase
MSGARIRRVNLNDQQRAYLERNHAAAMITLHPDGFPAAVRVGVALVDGKLWSSGTPERKRTAYLRRDPRSTLFVYESGGFSYLTLESRVTIREGHDAPQQHVRLFRVMQNRPSGPLLWNGVELSEEKFLQTMLDEHRLIYEFDPFRIYP